MLGKTGLDANKIDETFLHFCNVWVWNSVFVFHRRCRHAEAQVRTQRVRFLRRGGSREIPE